MEALLSWEGSEEQRREGELSKGALRWGGELAECVLGTSMLGQGEWAESSWEESTLGCRWAFFIAIRELIQSLNTRPESTGGTSVL